MPSWLEIFGFVTGSTCVLLGMYENVWNWPVGIASNLALCVLFWRNGVYAASTLQVLYIGIAIYGWWYWLHGGRRGGRLSVARASVAQRALIGIAVAAATVALHALLRRYTDSTVPWRDALTTALAVAAQYLLSRKLLECWIVWILADVIYIALACSKGLYVAAALYAVFLLMCIAGFTRWQRVAMMSVVDSAKA